MGSSGKSGPVVTLGGFGDKHPLNAERLQCLDQGRTRLQGKIEEYYLEFHTPTGKPRAGREAPRLAGL